MATVANIQTLETIQAETVRQISERRQEPEWLSGQRRRAWEQYQDAPLPDRVTHLWRYTDPQPFVLQADGLVGADGDTRPAPGDLARRLEQETHSAVAVCHNGRLVERRVDPALAQGGLVLDELHRAAWEHPGLVEPYLGRLVGAEHGKFEALNCALWQGGLFLYVPRHMVVRSPVHLLTSADSETVFLAPRLLVVVQEGAQLTLVDEYTSREEAELYSNAVVELVVLPSAHVRYVAIQDFGERVTSYMTQRANVERDSEVLSVFAGLGGNLVKADLGSYLVGRGANVKLLGVTFAQHGQHFDHHTVHEHQSGDTSSDLDFKVALKDKARSVYTGLIRIGQKARNCEAYQENRNLLLSSHCRAETIPELEILNDEVKCTHGATLGPIDKEQLFYLAARGIPRDEAIRMIVSGFVEPTFQEVPEDLRERLRSYVEARVREI